MNRIWWTPLVFAAVGCASISAFGQTITYATAGELRDDCAAIPAMLRGDRRAISAAGECIAFIDGVRAFAQVIEAERGLRILCLPARITTVELAGIYVRAVDGSPEQRADAAAKVLYRTLAEAFRCEAGPSQPRG